MVLLSYCVMVSQHGQNLSVMTHDINPLGSQSNLSTVLRERQIKLLNQSYSRTYMHTYTQFYSSRIKIIIIIIKKIHLFHADFCRSQVKEKEMDHVQREVTHSSLE